MKKLVVSAFLLLSIISCDSDDQQTFDDFVEVIELFQSDEVEEDGANVGINSQNEGSNSGVTNDNELQSVTGVGEIVTIRSENKTDLLVTGSNNSVNIETNVGKLIVDGSNNLLSFSPNTSVDFCTVAGSDNTAQKDESVIISCEISGSGNMGF